MTEKVLSGKKNGMAVLLLTVALYIAAIVFIILGGSRGIIPLFVLGLIWVVIGWLPLLGLKVLKPKEALVLTLFGKYAQRNNYIYHSHIVLPLQNIDNQQLVYR